MSKLRIQRGIPASGKTTDALLWVSESPETRARVNRDDIRYQLFGKYWGVDELAVTKVQDASLRALLKAGKDVVLDNTNLAASYVKKTLKLAAEFGAEVEFKDFPITYEDAVTRDLGRDRRVGYKVIKSFFDRYTPNGKMPPIPTIDAKASTAFEPYVYTPGLPHCIIVDIDGTLAHMDDRRGPYDDTKYHLDRFDEVLGRLSFWWAQSENADVIVLSGRDDAYREATDKWLHANRFNFYEALYMRSAGDTRNDAIVKNELFEKHIAGRYNVDFILDDRDRVVNMWRAKGLKCLQVAPGDF